MRRGEKESQGVRKRYVRLMTLITLFHLFGEGLYTVKGHYKCSATYILSRKCIWALLQFLERTGPGHSPLGLQLSWYVHCHCILIFLFSIPCAGFSFPPVILLLSPTAEARSLLGRSLQQPYYFCAFLQLLFIPSSKPRVSGKRKFTTTHAGADRTVYSAY